MNASDKAKAYVRGIRNPAKRAYAQSYLLWLCQEGKDFRTGKPRTCPSGAGLSYMAAQAVRNQLDEYQRESAAIAKNE